MENNNLIEVEVVNSNEVNTLDTTSVTQLNTASSNKTKSKNKIVLITLSVLLVVIVLGLGGWFVFGKQLSYYKELDCLPTLDSFDNRFVLENKEVNDSGETIYSYSFNNNLEFEECSVEYCKTLIDKNFKLYYNPKLGTLTENKLAPTYWAFYDAKKVALFTFVAEKSVVEISISKLAPEDELTESEMDEISEDFISEGLLRKEEK